MRKLLYVIIMITILILGACSSTNNAEDGPKESGETNESKENELSKEGKSLSDKSEFIDEKTIIKKNPIVVFKTNIDAAKPTIGEEEYKKYNEIMDYLYDHPEKEEELLFKELESLYNEPAEDLSEFIQTNMQEVVNYEMGKSQVGEILEESDVQNIIKEFFEENIQDKSLLDINPGNSDVDVTAFRAIAKGDFKYEGESFDYIIKTEHTKDLKQVEVFQLKVNKYNIDLN